MKQRPLRILVPGIVATAAIMLAGSVGAQTAPAPVSPPAAKSHQAAPTTGHHMSSDASAKHEADMKKACEAMMAKKQQMQDKLLEMDATLDKLVAEMNAAKASKEPDAMEKPMAAVINELVAQRKAMRAMAMDMQPEMMAHMVQHMHMHGAKGAMECPMMKTRNAPEPKAQEKKL